MCCQVKVWSLVRRSRTECDLCPLSVITNPRKRRPWPDIGSKDHKKKRINTLQSSHYRNKSTCPLGSAEHTLANTRLNDILNKADIHVKSSIIRVRIIHCYISVFHPTPSSAFSAMENKVEEAVHCSGRSTAVGLTGRREMVAPQFVLFYQTSVANLRKTNFLPEICNGIVGWMIG